MRALLGSAALTACALLFCAFSLAGDQIMTQGKMSVSLIIIAATGATLFWAAKMDFDESRKKILDLSSQSLAGTKSTALSIGVIQEILDGNLTKDDIYADVSTSVRSVDADAEEMIFSMKLAPKSDEAEKKVEEISRRLRLSASSSPSERHLDRNKHSFRFRL